MQLYTKNSQKLFYGLFALIIFISCKQPTSDLPQDEIYIPENIDIYEFGYDFSYKGSIEVTDSSGTTKKEIKSIYSEPIKKVDPVTYTTTDEYMGIRFVIEFYEFEPRLIVSFSLDSDRQLLLADYSTEIRPDLGIQWEFNLKERYRAYQIYETTNSFSVSSNHALDEMSIRSIDEFDCNDLLNRDPLYSKFSDIIIKELDIHIDFISLFYLIGNVESKYSYNELINYNSNDILSLVDDTNVFIDPNNELLKFINNIKLHENDHGALAVILYDWVNSIIYYDYDFINNRDLGTGDRIDEILLLQRAVCEGYAKLYYEVCKLAGFSVKYISGYAGPISSTYSHAWNAIQINGDVYMLDTTWDSLNKYKNNVFIYNDSHREYFLKDPELWKYLRFPENPNNQFSDNPISNQTYETERSEYNYDGATIRAEGFDNNISLPEGLFYKSTNGRISIIVEHSENLSLGFGNFIYGTITTNIINPTTTEFILDYTDLNAQPRLISLMISGSMTHLASVIVEI